MQKLAFRLVVFIASIPIVGRSQTQDFVVMDSSYFQGNVVVIKDNTRIQFQLSKKATPIIYTADEIKEFGAGSKLYESIRINGERRFYQNISKGRVSIYKWGSSYFVKVSDSIHFLTKKNFRSELISRMPYIDENEMFRLNYSLKSLRKFGSLVNSDECDLTKLPFPKVGLIAGYSSVKLRFYHGENSKSSYYDNRSATNSFTFGLFYDKPVFTPASLFFTSELDFSYMNTSFFYKGSNFESFIKSDIVGITAPIGIKWVMRNGSVKPYLKGGGLVSYLKLDFPEGSVDATIDSSTDTVIISTGSIEDSNGILGGFYAGIGTEVSHKDRLTLHFDLKYEKAFEAAFDSNRVGFSGIFVGCGISF